MVVDLLLIIKIIKSIPFPHPVYTPVIEDREKPVFEASLEIKFFQILEHVDECLLTGIFGILSVS